MHRLAHSQLCLPCMHAESVLRSAFPRFHQHRHMQLNRFAAQQAQYPKMAAASAAALTRLARCAGHRGACKLCMSPRPVLATSVRQVSCDCHTRGNQGTVTAGQGVLKCARECVQRDQRAEVCSLISHGVVTYACAVAQHTILVCHKIGSQVTILVRQAPGRQFTQHDVKAPRPRFRTLYTWSQEDCHREATAGRPTQARPLLLQPDDKQGVVLMCRTER